MAADLDPLGGQPQPRTRVPLKLEEVVIAASMAAIALITVANVVTRYLSQISLAFTEEYSVVLMVVVTIVGSAYACAGGRHIRITYFLDRLSPSRQRMVEIAAMALTLLMFAIILIWGVRLTWDEYRFDVSSTGMGHPQWLFTGVLPVFSVVVIGRCIGRIMRLVRGEAS